VVTACARANLPDVGASFAARLLFEASPSTDMVLSTANTALSLLARASISTHRAAEALRRFPELGLEPDASSYQHAVEGLVRAGRLAEAMELEAECGDCGPALQPLLLLAAKEGEGAAVRRLVGRLEEGRGG
jgi:hypothetical protein